MSEHDKVRGVPILEVLMDSLREIEQCRIIGEHMKPMIINSMFEAFALEIPKAKGTVHHPTPIDVKSH